MRALENSCSFLTNERPAEGAQELFFFFFKEQYWKNVFGVHLFIYTKYILSIYLVQSMGKGQEMYTYKSGNWV